MRILHVITSADPAFGGPIEGIKQRARVLEEWGHQVEVATVDDPSAAFIPDFPLPLYPLGPRKTSLAYSPNLLPWLKEHIRDYDAIVVNGLWQYPSLAARKAAQAANMPYWVFTHGMLDPYFDRAFPLKKLKKNVFWIWQYPVLRDAKAVLFTCEEEKLLARQSFSPYKVRERVVAYGTGGPSGDAEGERKAFREKFPQLADRRFFLFLSRIDPKKGCDLLLEAFARVKDSALDVQLVMAGPAKDPYKSELDAIVARHGMADRVIWAGMLQGPVKWGAFRTAEAFILPSHQENFGIAVVEALASGLPVLISKPVNIWREIVEDNAGIVDEDTVDGAEAVMRKWLALPQAAREAMREHAATCFQNRFTVEKSAQSLLDVIAEGKGKA